MNWIPLLVVVDACLFVLAWYLVSYRPWKRRLDEQGAPFKPPPNPFYGPDAEEEDE